MRQDRMFAVLAGFFALVALLLGAIGIYGVVAYGVERRTAEIGIRVALGASGRAVVRLVMGETLALVAVGAVLGLPVALAAVRLIRGLLYGLEPWDPAAIASAMFVLFATAATTGFSARSPRRRDCPLAGAAERVARSVPISVNKRQVRQHILK